MKNNLPVILVSVCLLAETQSSMAAAEDAWNFDDIELEGWTGLIQSIFGCFFVMVGVHLLLHNHLAKYSLWKKYIKEGRSLAGDVLSYDSTSDGKFEVSVLYTAPVHKFKDARNQYRHPDALEYKRFLCQCKTNRPIERGASAVEVLLLRGMPRSGCVRETVEHNIRDHSHLRTVLILMPSMALLSLFVWISFCAITSMDEDQKKTGWAIFISTLLIIIFGLQRWFERRFEKEKIKITNSAVAMTISKKQQHHQMHTWNNNNNCNSDYVLHLGDNERTLS